MYRLIRVYDDLTCMAEHSDSLPAILMAAGLYLQDADCCKLEIDDCQNDMIIMDYYR